MLSLRGPNTPAGPWLTPPSPALTRCSTGTGQWTSPMTWCTCATVRYYVRLGRMNFKCLYNLAIPSSSWVRLLGQQRPGSSLDSWVIELSWFLDMNMNFAEQPKYIQSIVGYSPTTGRTYFKDKKGKAYLSTFDGVRMDVVNPSNMATVGYFWLLFV